MRPSSTTVAADRHLVVNHVRLHYRELGDPAAPPVLVLHGIMGHTREWDVLTAALAERHRVVAVDQRGHGESAWAGDYRLPALAGDVTALLPALGLGRAHLVGHSLGGMVAATVAASRPDLVDRLVLLDITPDSVAPDAVREQLVSTLRGFAVASYAALGEALAQWQADRWAREPLLRHYLEHVLVPGDDGRLRYRFDAAGLTQFPRSVDAAELWRAVAGISAPTLVVHGRHSEFTPAEAVAALLPRLPRGSAAVEIPDAGHDLGVQQPEAVAAAVAEFLTRDDPAGR